MTREEFWENLKGGCESILETMSTGAGIAFFVFLLCLAPCAAVGLTWWLFFK